MVPRCHLHAASRRKVLMSCSAVSSALDESQHRFFLPIVCLQVVLRICYLFLSNSCVTEVPQPRKLGSILASLGNAIVSKIKVEDLSVKDAIIA